jgi:SAM-dependent methyltransferase
MPQASAAPETAQREQWANTARVAFSIGKFDATTASAEDTLKLLSNFAFDYQYLQAITRSLEVQRPDLFEPTVTKGGVQTINPAAQPLRGILANETSRRIPPELAKAFKDNAWDRYYDRTAQNAPSPLLALGLQRYFGTEPRRPGVIVDLGSGAGVDAQKMLAMGWQVVAVDPQPGAMEALRGRVPEADRSRLTALQQTFEDASLPANADVIYSHRTLPHVAKEKLPQVLAKISASLRPGGYFIANFFPPTHAFAGRPGMSFLTEAQVRDLLPKELEVVDLRNNEGQVELTARKRGGEAPK